MESGKSPARAALLGVLVFFCVGLAVAVGVIIYSKETAPPAPPPAVDEEYLARKKAEAEERAASEAGAEEAKKKWREENEHAEQLAERAAKITKGMKLDEIETLMGSEALGSCKDKDGHRAYIWDTGPAHTPILVALKKGRFSYGKLTTIRNPELRALMMPLAEGGKCKPPDYDSVETATDKDKPTITLLSRRASRLKTGMRLAEVKRTLGADPIGSCLSSLNDGARSYVWDNGPKHALVKVTMKSGKVIGWDEGRLENESVREIQLRSHLKGGCNEDDPK